MPEGDWAGALEGKRPWRASLHIVASIAKGRRGGSGAFLALGSDENKYWVKVLTGPQGPRVPVTEQIVGRVGALIGAPVCSVAVAYVPKALAGWEYRGGILQAVRSHASLHLVASATAKDRGCTGKTTRRAKVPHFAVAKTPR